MSLKSYRIITIVLSILAIVSVGTASVFASNIHQQNIKNDVIKLENKRIDKLNAETKKAHATQVSESKSTSTASSNQQSSTEQPQKYGIFGEITISTNGGGLSSANVTTEDDDNIMPADNPTQTPIQ